MAGVSWKCCVSRFLFRNPALAPATNKEPIQNPRQICPAILWRRLGVLQACDQNAILLQPTQTNPSESHPTCSQRKLRFLLGSPGEKSAPPPERRGLGQAYILRDGDFSMPKYHAPGIAKEFSYEYKKQYSLGIAGDFSYEKTVFPKNC